MCLNIPYEIRRIAKRYGVTVYRDVENCDNNTAFCTGDEIFIGKFDDHDIELIAFFS